eukprot:Gb_24019 [translate_table: standard]
MDVTEQIVTEEIAMEEGCEGMAKFTGISEDILINIFSKLEDDPRYLACLVCVCTRFSAVIRTTCWKYKCMGVIPTVVADLLQTTRRTDRLVEPPGGWAALHKLAVCCPGLWHAGVLLESWDFGLERELGPSEEYEIETRPPTARYETTEEGTSGNQSSSSWTLFDDLHFDMEYGIAEFSAYQQSNTRTENMEREPSMPMEENHAIVRTANECQKQGNPSAQGLIENPRGDFRKNSNEVIERNPTEGTGNPNVEIAPNPAEVTVDSCKIRENRSEETSVSRSEISENPSEHKRNASPLHEGPHDQIGIDLDRVNENGETHSRKRKKGHSVEPHLATGVWNLTREQGNKLLASRFRSDSLYICDWPGCIHSEEKRKYSLFRGIFKNFKNSRVWRNINDMKAKKTVVNCAFCSSKGTWDMLTTFCLRRSFEYHDDGEPVVRAYVCENGHVAGAWTDRPMYN